MPLWYLLLSKISMFQRDNELDTHTCQQWSESLEMSIQSPSFIIIANSAAAKALTDTSVIIDNYP